MLDIKDIRANPERLKKALADRLDNTDVEAVLALDRKQRDAQKKFEDVRARQNALSKEIGKAKRTGEDVSALMKEAEELPGKVKDLESIAKNIEKKLRALLLTLPNNPHESVPIGEDAHENPVVREWGDKPNFDFEPKWHDDIGEALGIIDFERAAKVAGARFALMQGLGARLEHALTQFMLETHTRDHGYTEVLPPFMITTDAMTGTGQLPKFADDSFQTTAGDHWLAPTAEVPVTNLHRDEILDAADLPIKYVAYTPCFRSEAGSYGKDTRGMIRLHQFNKVELVQFTTPATSYDAHEELTAHAEKILQALGLHYRVVSLCTGDLGFAAAKCYDLEVWLPGQGEYREISSCSNFEAFQARRANIRYRPTPAGGAKSKPEFVHTLNGSGLAVGRTIVAILEQYQQKDGSVVIPEVLRDYMKVERITGHRSA